MSLYLAPHQTFIGMHLGNPAVTSTWLGCGGIASLASSHAENGYLALHGFHQLPLRTYQGLDIFDDAHRYIRGSHRLFGEQHFKAAVRQHHYYFHHQLTPQARWFLLRHHGNAAFVRESLELVDAKRSGIISRDEYVDLLDHAAKLDRALAMVYSGHDVLEKVVSLKFQKRQDGVSVAKAFLWLDMLEDLIELPGLWNIAYVSRSEHPGHLDFRVSFLQGASKLYSGRVFPLKLDHQAERRYLNMLHGVAMAVGRSMGYANLRHHLYVNLFDQEDDFSDDPNRLMEAVNTVAEWTRCVEWGHFMLSGIVLEVSHQRYQKEGRRVMVYFNADHPQQLGTILRA
ncbi:MAG: hypothetical protein HY540_01175 [Deltaproteobacteria bacterium]|nr:hypothetical protein [Deltaproteobacteria bacterium]